MENRDKATAEAGPGGKASRIEKPWGYEELLVKTDHYVVKILHVRDGHQTSLQKHVKKTETMYVLSGAVALYSDGQIYTAVDGGFVHIPNGTIHRLGTAGKGDCTVLEVSTPELDDVVRLADDYGR